MALPPAHHLPMSPARRLTLAVGSPLALAAIGWGSLWIVSGVGQASYHAQATIPVHGARFSLDGGDGSVTLGPSGDGRVHLSATVHYSLIRASISWTTTSQGVVVKSRCPLPTPLGCSFDYHLAIPPGLIVDASTGSGDIQVSGLSGGVTLSTDSGDLVVHGLAGPLRLDTSSGSVAATGLKGGSVSAGTDSGDVSLRFARVPADVRATTSSGDIAIALPPGPTPYQVGASSSSGSSTVRVPTSSTSHHHVHAATDSGDISVVN
jgi:hypothetical protein